MFIMVIMQAKCNSDLSCLSDNHKELMNEYLILYSPVSICINDHKFVLWA